MTEEQARELIGELRTAIREEIDRGIELFREARAVSDEAASDRSTLVEDVASIKESAELIHSLIEGRDGY